jgi:pantoate--beta-alanine ligase
MIICKRPQDVSEFLASKRSADKSVGFVPTMGALHDGHLQLVRQARTANNVVACSIFVNPVQFNDPEDFKKYPKTIEQDIFLLEKAGCDVLLLPAVDAIYPDGLKHSIRYDLGSLETTLEGQYRPGHFQGVCRVVHRLLDITQPDRLYLGQKDFQQCMVISRLLKLIGSKAEVVISPTLREADGLAMSSRNMRLSTTQRQKAPAIYQALNSIRENIHTHEPAQLKRTALEALSLQGLKVDYVEIADTTTLHPVETVGNQQLVALVAAYLGEIRLIDNMILN